MQSHWRNALRAEVEWKSQWPLRRTLWPVATVASISMKGGTLKKGLVMRCGAATGRLGVFGIGCTVINKQSTIEEIPPPLRTYYQQKAIENGACKAEVRGWLALTFERRCTQLAFAD